jgi:hypothetical protein
MRILIFASEDAPNNELERAHNLAELLKGRPVRVINKLSTDLEDLQLVAHYRIISTPVVIALKNSTTKPSKHPLYADEVVLFRQHSIPTAESIDDFEEHTMY